MSHPGEDCARDAVASIFSDWEDEATKCSRCGFCQPTCPIYRATGREAHVARGKNVLFRKMVEGTQAVEADLREAYDNCLLCRACTANCFPAVRTDALVLAFREAYAARWGRPFVQRLIFRTLLPRPTLVATTFSAAWSLQLPRLGGLVQRSGLLGLLNPKMEMAVKLADHSPLPSLRRRLRELPLRPKTPRLRVGYWISCGYNYMLPEVGVDTVRVLRALGAEVVPLDNHCCGLPAHAYGDREAARALARRNLERLGDVGHLDAVVSECGSCSDHLKEYGALLADDAEYADLAARLSSRMRAFSEFVAELDTPLPLGRLEATVTYHDPCHMTARYQGVTRQPRELIASIPGVRLKELTEADSCCGAAGSYSLLHPGVSARIRARKTEFIAESEAAYVVTECPSCLLQLALGVRELPVQAVSTSQLLALALAPGP